MVIQTLTLSKAQARKNGCLRGTYVEFRKSIIVDDPDHTELGVFNSSGSIFKKNSIITEYSGRLLNRAGINRLSRKQLAYTVTTDNRQYCHGKFSWDLKPHEGFGSIVNCPNRGEKPNCKITCIGKKRYFIKAIRNIYPGEELSVSYSSSYWTYHRRTNLQEA